MLSNTPIAQTDAMNLAMLWRGQDKSAWQIKELLVQRGLSELVAQLIADKADEKQTQAEERLRKEQNKGTNRKIIVGLIFCVGGLIVTFVTMDSGNGGIIAWGAILFGIIDIVIGASQRVSG